MLILLHGVGAGPRCRVAVLNAAAGGMERAFAIVGAEPWDLMVMD